MIEDVQAKVIAAETRAAHAESNLHALEAWSSFLGRSRDEK